MERDSACKSVAVFPRTSSLAERLLYDLQHLRELAKALPAGPDREIHRKIQQSETAAHISEWLGWPGPRAPQ
jgi:hypothetical protein